MRKKRGYKRDTPHELVRDYKLFAIACEGGKREPEYFSLFENISKRVSVDIIEDKVRNFELITKYETKSAPNWVLDRAIKYVEKEGLIEDDDLWFVMDRDKWSVEQLRRIASYCDDRPNWHIVISNPCFEIWLYFHKKNEIPNRQTIKCKELKTMVAELKKGGYHPNKFIHHLLQANANARDADQNKAHFMPDKGVTKVYLLTEALLFELGNNDFEAFLKNI